MRSAALRVTIGATAWIALGAGAAFLYRSEQHIAQQTAALNAFDQRAREAADALVEARVAQQAYVAAGQGIGFWMPKVTSGTESAQTALLAMRDSVSAVAQAPLEQATTSAAEFSNIEKRVREYLKAGQQLMAADVIFTEGTDAAATSVRQIESARQAQHQALDANIAGLRKQEALVAGAAAGVAALVVLLLTPVGRRSADREPAIEESCVSGAERTEPVVAPVAPPAPRRAEPPSLDVRLAASLATEFGRVRDLEELKRVLGSAAEAMDASGVMVWMASPGSGELRIVLAHGYPADVLAKIPPVPRSADNAAAAAYRSGTLQIVLARPGGASGAIVAPILSADGCIGALSAEIRHRAETSEAVQALAEITAAHLAGVLAQAPADVAPPRAAAQA